MPPTAVALAGATIVISAQVPRVGNPHIWVIVAPFLYEPVRPAAASRFVYRSRSDFLGIARWIFEIYTPARWAGISPDLSFNDVRGQPHRRTTGARRTAREGHSVPCHRSTRQCALIAVPGCDVAARSVRRGTGGTAARARTVESGGLDFAAIGTFRDLPERTNSCEVLRLTLPGR
jgi:hypothetical protein